MCALTKFLHDLIKKVPKAEEVVHTKPEEGLDPFEENDMRQCLAILLARYRKNDELGVLTTVIQGMGEKQGSKDLATHVKNCEDFLKNLIRLEIHSISAEDLVAIIAIAGMNETHRTEFMKQHLLSTIELLSIKTVQMMSCRHNPVNQRSRCVERFENFLATKEIQL